MSEIKSRNGKRLDYIGRKIKLRRELLGISQACLAEKVDLSTLYISSIECGERIPSLKTFVDIANALSTSADFLLADVIDTKTDDYAKMIIKMIEQTFIQT